MSDSVLQKLPTRRRALLSDGVIEDASAALVGRQISDLRRARHMTLQQLSEVSGVSQGYLSQIERGISEPTIKTLRQIARAFDVTVGWLLRSEPIGPAHEREVVVRRNDRRILRFADGSCDELLSPNLRGQLQLMMSTFRAGSESNDLPMQHRGEEAGIILAGRIVLELDGAEIFLEAGDSFSFESTRPHRYVNSEAEDAIVLFAMTPPYY
jgi:transcriptional regulator with XRE-family HTH domain